MAFPILYEINTRCWLRELSERAGHAVTLANVPQDEFAEWQRLGFTHLWLMGVWTSGPRARECALSDHGLRATYEEALPGFRDEDVGPSPYAIAEYRVRADLGGDEGLQAFRRNLHAHGLKLLLDFVPNHVGLDHPWLTQRPELFVQSVNRCPGTFAQQTPAGLRWFAHGKDPNWGAWSDTAQLDYRSATTRAALIEVLKSVAERCDGVRCDMAMLVLNEVCERTWKEFPRVQSAHPARAGETQRAEPGLCPPIEFWQVASSATKQTHPEFILLAEVYWGMEERLQKLGFDYTYDKVLYDALVARDGAGVQRRLSERPAEAVAKDAHFLENHDERRAAAMLSPAEERAAALVSLGLPGMRFLHEGQLSGAQRRVPVQLLRRSAEPVQAELRQAYERMLTTLQTTAVGQGKGELLKPRSAWPGNPTFENFVLVQWQAKGPEFDLVVVNPAPHRGQCYAPLTVSGLKAHNWTMKDRLGDEQYVRWGDNLQDQGLYLDVPPHGAQLFHFQPTA